MDHISDKTSWKAIPMIQNTNETCSDQNAMEKDTEGNEILMLLRARKPQTVNRLHWKVWWVNVLISGEHRDPW